MRSSVILFLLLVSPLLIGAQSNVQFEPALPKAGQSVIIRHLQMGADAPVSFLVYQISDAGTSLNETTAVNKNNQWTASVQAAPSTKAMVVVAMQGAQVDNNLGKGYQVWMHDKAGQKMAGTGFALAKFYRENARTTELQADVPTRLSWMDEDIKKQPTYRNTHFLEYARHAVAGTKDSVQLKKLKAELKTKTNVFNGSEKEGLDYVNVFRQLKMKEEADALESKLAAKSPSGKVALRKAINAIANGSEDPLIKAEQLIALAGKFKFQDVDDSSNFTNTWMRTVQQVAVEKKVELLSKGNLPIGLTDKAMFLNSIAWPLAEKGEQLDLAKKLAEEAYNSAKYPLSYPEKFKPSLLSERQWKENAGYAAAMVGDTWAYTLYKSGEYDKASKVQKDVLEVLPESADNTEYVTRLLEILQEAKSPELYWQLEKAVSEGKAAESQVTTWKTWLKDQGVSDEKINERLNLYQAYSRNKKIAELSSKMISVPAPGFKLRDLQGKEVALADLKGKVVVLDFWATWCGPCKASFPGMQKAVDKYKNDKDVVFLFVDTWERVPDPAKAAGDFIASKNYTFQVLLDNENTVVSAFGVQGIPTKFVLDGQGKIRFTSVGFSGSEDGLVEELSLMVESARKAGNP